MTVTLLRALMSLVIGIVGGAVGVVLVLWAQGRNSDNVGAIVATVSTLVAVIGWYQSTRLQADAQRELLHLQLLNEARRVLVRVLHDEQDRLRTCAVRIHVLRFSDPVTTELRNSLAQLLRNAPGHDVAFNWLFAIEEHEALFSEVRTARIQLSMRGQKLAEEFRKFADVLASAGELPRQFDAAVAELFDHTHDQEAMLRDLSIHIQNRALGAVSGHRAQERKPPDNRVPRLVDDGGDLVIHVPDETRRVQMQIGGWLPPKNPPGS